MLSWTLSRSSGLVAYLLLWASVCLGLLHSMGVKRLSTPAARIDLHEFLALAGIYTTVFHGVVLLWNQHASFTWGGLLIPFASEYEPFFVGIGTVSFYLALLASITTYVRKYMSATLWRTIHQFSLVGFTMALVHGVFLGPDTQITGIWLMYVVTAVSVAALVAARIFKGVFSPADSARRG